MNVEHDYQFLYLVDDRWNPDLSVEEIFNMRILTDCNILINKVFRLYTLIQKGSHSEVFEEFAKRVGEQEAHNYITELRSSASKSRSPSLQSRKSSADAQQTVENKRKKLSSVKVRYQSKVMFNKLRFFSITFIYLKKMVRILVLSLSFKSSGYSERGRGEVCQSCRNVPEHHR